MCMYNEYCTNDDPEVCESCVNASNFDKGKSIMGMPQEANTKRVSRAGYTERAPETDKLGTGAAKHDADKTKWHLLPWRVIEGVAKVMTFGANKYSENGWKKLAAAEDRYFSAMMRHKMLMDAGEYTDPDSGLPHWAHFACNAVFLGYFALKKEENKG